MIIAPTVRILPLLADIEQKQLKKASRLLSLYLILQRSIYEKVNQEKKRGFDLLALNRGMLSAHKNLLMFAVEAQ